MSTAHAELFARLAARFEANQVKRRPQGGRYIHYITGRTVMNRLDDVLGPENWWDLYTPHENSVYCRLTIRMPDGSTLTKCDAGGYAGMDDQGDDDKSGYSDAFKRAAVKFGVGRYLYRDGVPEFVRAVLGETGGQPGQQDRPRPSPSPRPQGNGSGTPRTGKALFAWLRVQGDKINEDLIKRVNTQAKRSGWPARIVDFTEQQVREVVDLIQGRPVQQQTAPPMTQEEADADECPEDKE